MRIAILGCTGRMGINLLKETEANKDTELSAGIVRKNSGFLGQDLGLIMAKDEIGINATADLDDALKFSDALIDFTNPETTIEALEYTTKHKKIHLIGTTGFNDDQRSKIQKASKKTVILKTPNTSFGVNILTDIVKKVASQLDKDFDIEIVEMHHKSKKDAPSGTALELAKAAFDGRHGTKTDKKLDDVICNFRNGVIGTRPKDEIGIAVLRGGSNVGEHTVIFAGMGETVEIRHQAYDRKIFAKGAIKSVLWAKSKSTGYYTMKDVMGL